jgi:hypothetical protein
MYGIIVYWMIKDCCVVIQQFEAMAKVGSVYGFSTDNDDDIDVDDMDDGELLEMRSILKTITVLAISICCVLTCWCKKKRNQKVE